MLLPGVLLLGYLLLLRSTSIILGMGQYRFITFYYNWKSSTWALCQAHILGRPPNKLEAFQSDHMPGDTDRSL